jgi:flagellin FlaB
MINKKAESGIGTLIVFIAMILVAAIAAGVLIQTATSLQSKALLTGERAKDQISTAVTTLLIYAEDGSSGNSVDYFSLKLKLAPGSDPIQLNGTLVEIDLKDNSSDLTYATAADANCSNTSSLDNGEFGVDYLITSGSTSSGYIARGDIVKICFKSPRSVTPDEDIAVRIIPKSGVPISIETAMPEVINQQRIYIYP